MKALIEAAWNLSLRPFYSGMGCVICLHRVIPEAECSTLKDNRAIEMTPDDLRAILTFVRERGLEPVHLDAVPERLAKPRRGKFICFTFDDGYRDNLTYALPIFREFRVPFAVTLTTGFIEGKASVWWYQLERILSQRERLSFCWDGQTYELDGSSEAARADAFSRLAGLIRSSRPQACRELLGVICAAANTEPTARTRELMMTWDEARRLASDELVTIAAHTVGHYSLNRLSDEEVRTEMLGSKREIEEKLGRTVRHFAYPFGGRNAVGPREFQLARECGFTTALTTRNANLFPIHARHLFSLPRLSLSGNYPALARFRKLESGLVPAMEWRFQRVILD